MGEKVPQASNWILVSSTFSCSNICVCVWVGVCVLILGFPEHDLFIFPSCNDSAALLIHPNARDRTWKTRYKFHNVNTQPHKLMKIWIIIYITGYLDCYPVCVCTRVSLDPVCNLASKEIPDEQVPWLTSRQHNAAVPTETTTFPNTLKDIS